jgi:hypothetical protein
MSANPNSKFICGTGKSLCKGLQRNTIYTIYTKRYRQDYFPKLLESPDVPYEDKQKIRDLLQKPWNPYVFRHSALTQKSIMLKEHVLRQHAGWSGRSQTHLKYLHYFGNESSESLLEAYGIVTKDQQSVDVLRSKQCPNCNEPNKPDSKFCAKCRMVLTYDAYSETVEEKAEKDKEVELLKEQVSSMQSAQKEILELLKDPDKLLAVLKQDK